MRNTEIGKPLGPTQACCPVDDTKAVTILDQLSIIEQTLGETGSLINTLHSKLTPILRLETPTGDNQGCVDQTCLNGEVVRQLLNITDALRIYNTSIADIICRLEIA